MKSALLPCLALALVCAACATASDPSQPAQRPLELAAPPIDRLLKVPAEELSIPNQSDAQKLKRRGTLEELINEMERLTGIHFVVDVETMQIVSRIPTGNQQSLVVPPDRAWSVFEALLADRAFCMTVVSEEPLLLSVFGSQPHAGRMSGPRERAVVVPSAELPLWAGHPAFMITSTVDLETVNIRDLSNSMRQMFTDPSTQQIIPMGNTNTLMLTGRAPAVVTLAALLKDIDKAELARQEKERKLPPEQQGRTGVTPRQ
jgi:type II secretory pathway component GspD/PulD (secretin)